MKKGFTVLLMAACAFLLVAGTVDKVHAKADGLLLDTSVTYVGETENDSNSVDTKIQRTLVELKGNYPIPVVPEKHILMLGGAWVGHFIEYDDYVPITYRGQVFYKNDLPDALYTLDFVVGFVSKWNDKWSSAFQAKPGIHSDFEDISEKDWVFSGSAMAIYNLDGRNSVGFGLANGDNFGRVSVFPLLKVNWYPTAQIYVEALLPLDLDAGFMFSDRLSAGFEGKVRGYQYRLSDDNDSWNDKVLRYKEVRFGPYVDYAFSPKAHLRASAGVVTGQEASFRDDDNDKKLAKGEYENTGYATVNFYMPF